jgi:hypothetical protein
MPATCLKSSLRLAALFLICLSPAPSVGEAVPPARSFEVRAASQFLRALEEGRTGDAFHLLVPESQRAFSVDDLNPGTPLGSRGGFRRMYQSRHDLPVGMVSGFGVRPLTSRYRVVCFQETPAGGFGAVHYIAVLLRQTSAVDWGVVSYRVQSSADNNC